MLSWSKRTRSASQTDLAASAAVKRRKTHKSSTQSRKRIAVPSTQSKLVLNAVREPYNLSEKQDIPAIQGDSELLVKVEAIGLNPIDWKAP